MAKVNETWLLRLLLDAPMTCEWALQASAAFPKPYRSLGRVREVLAELAERGLLRRVPLLETHQGQRRWLYFLAPAAKRLLPELGDLRASAAPFQPPRDPQAHTLAVAEFVAHLYRSVGESRGRARLLVSLRDGMLRADLDLPKARGRRLLRQVVPDHTALVELDGRPQLLLLELQNRGAVILPGSPQSVSRSFQFKLAKHKAWLATFRAHPIVAQMLAHGPLPGFRTLVVTTRGEAHLRNLLSAATPYAKLFYFTSLEKIRTRNLLLDPIWELPNGSVRAIADEPRPSTP